eukprot:TRINITY_DN11637_c2_g1_i1.p2 TRINITY_DN11637_c2_g1~~TRINITY_DN11637_c2_g1_i1.p2  ORF type:complete len:358 (+),score=99.74 TRINITY_DN11637_c2_g1_i1:73-1146(+)
MVVGVSSLLGAFLGPTKVSELDPNVILQKEVDKYVSQLTYELSHYRGMPRHDREALGELYTRRLQRTQRAMDNVKRFNSLFQGRQQRRTVVEMDRVTLGIVPSMGYCNMHDLLIQFVRDWGSDNGNIRRTQHEVIAASVKKLAEANGGSLGSVLIPGDALCRLSYDMQNLGVFSEVEANEASPLFAEFAHFVLNCVESPFEISPHAGVPYNQMSVDAHLRNVMVPTPFPVPSPTPLKLTIGGFEELYRHKGARHREFDVLITCFFLDTIPGSVADALTIIAHLLRPGGHWINHGPLLYRGDAHPKLSWEEIRALLPSRKLDVVEDRHLVHTEYCEYTEGSLHPTVYNPVHLVARKLP